MEGKTKKIRYLRLEDEELILPQLGHNRGSIKVNLVTYQPGVLLPRLPADGKEFFQLINSDSVVRVKSFLEGKKRFSINCQNYAGVTGLTKAVSNGHLEMVHTLLEQPDIIIGDSVLHAVDKGNIPILEAVLQRLTQQGNDERASCYTETPDYSPDLTPIMLAAINENYEVIRFLLQRGHFVEKPHPTECFCKEQCWEHKKGESLRESMKRLSAYRALASPAYICQSSADPILTAFELSKEFLLISDIERESSKEYIELSKQCKKFAVDLLSQTRTSNEVQLLLKRKPGCLRRRRIDFQRLALAVDLEQKEFVSHPNCQQVLRSAWLRDWSDWKTLTTFQKWLKVFPRIFFLPAMALGYICMPYSQFARTLSSPINKFLSNCASYITFLILLFIQNYLDSIDHLRGPPHTGLEWIIVAYILGFTWVELKKVWFVGISGYFTSKWNLYNTVMLIFFYLTFAGWMWAFYDVIKNDNLRQERRFWKPYDPTLISEGVYAIATVLAFGHMFFIFQINNNIGPMEVSISRMYKDIAVFMAIFTIVIFSFATGIHKLYQYYIDQMYVNVHGIKIAQIQYFETFPHTLQTLFWSIFTMSPVESANVVLSPIGGNESHPVLNTHDFTQGVGHLLFATYHVIVIIVLVNMLIAMMSNSFQKVADNADMEWKFSRIRVWLSFFEEGGTLPPPFNLLPSPKSLAKIYWWCIMRANGDKRAKLTLRQCCLIEHQEETNSEGEYQTLMARLVQRYLRCKEKEHAMKSPTIADIDAIYSEIREMKTNRLKKIVSAWKSNTQSTV